MLETTLPSGIRLLSSSIIWPLIAYLRTFRGFNSAFISLALIPRSSTYATFVIITLDSLRFFLSYLSCYWPWFIVHKRIGFLSERDALTKKKLVKLYLAGEDPYEKSLMRGTLEDRVLSLSHKGN